MKPGFRFYSVLRKEYPLSYRTILFCFFAGSLLSIPCGILLNGVWEFFEPPTWTQPIYVSSVLVSFVAFPFWCLDVLRDRRLLRRIGISVRGISVLGVCLGLLFPKLH